MEGPVSFWGYKEQESNLILPEHDDDDEFDIASFCYTITEGNQKFFPQTQQGP